MAQVTVGQSGSGNAHMQCRITYEAGNGSITITNLEGCRTDGYDTVSTSGSASSNYVIINIAGTQTSKDHHSPIKFGKNYGWTTFWSGSSSKGGMSGNQTVTITFSDTVTSNIENSKFVATIDAGTSSVHVNGYIRNQNADGSWGNYWHWINEDVTPGTNVDYWGYGGPGGPDGAVYEPVHYSGTINSDTTFYCDAYRRTYWNNINAYQPNGSTENGLLFNLSDSRGNVWNNITNEPTDFTRRYGETATISNIRPNVTGAHYTKNSITGTNAGSFSWTFTEASFAANLYSAWNTYTIAYNANGGTGAPSPQTKTYGTNLTLSNTRPTKSNAKFLGWSTSSSATTATYQPGATLSTDLSTTQGATVTLYAVWAPAVKVVKSGSTIQAPVKIVTSSSVRTVKQVKVIKL